MQSLQKRKAGFNQQQKSRDKQEKLNTIKDKLNKGEIYSEYKVNSGYTSYSVTFSIFLFNANRSFWSREYLTILKESCIYANLVSMPRPRWIEFFKLNC